MVYHCYIAMFYRTGRTSRSAGISRLTVAWRRYEYRATRSGRQILNSTTSKFFPQLLLLVSIPRRLEISSYFQCLCVRSSRLSYRMEAIEVSSL
ncbi:hypothetical protein RRG08_016840 [Elysia crispata]|uniref:Uncharacterized protein n=1 Tax=Elysia crispata TaxID=231223 RepID=A0AAE0Z8I6_9GAST|nr:hypothetical protein RRG08_016840 [Elysia crispata]